jgi:hypothetical protein
LDRPDFSLSDCPENRGRRRQGEGSVEIREGAATPSLEIRDQKTPKTRRFACSGSKATAEARLRSGADCPWTEVKSIVAGVHCRKSGRLFRLTKASDLYPGMLDVTQVKTLDNKRVTYIGRYHTRTEATKVLLELISRPDWTA